MGGGWEPHEGQETSVAPTQHPEGQPHSCRCSLRPLVCSWCARSLRQPGSHLQCRHHDPRHPKAICSHSYWQWWETPLSGVATSDWQHLGHMQGPCHRETEHLISHFHNGKWGNNLGISHQIQEGYSKDDEQPQKSQKSQMSTT